MDSKGTGRPKGWLVIFTGLTLALNIIGGILVLTQPFGGFTVREPYIRQYGVQYYHSVDYWVTLGGSYGDFTDNLFIVLLAICLFAVALLSFMALIQSRSNFRKQIRRATILAIVTVVLAVWAEIAFDTSHEKYENSWVSGGFSAALVIGLVNSISYSAVLIFRKRLFLEEGGEAKIESSTKRSGEAAPSKEPDYIEQLKTLAKLRDEGVLTQREFEEKKAKILKNAV